LGNLKIKLEAEAIVFILSLVEDGVIELYDSEILRYELTRIPDSEKKTATLCLLTLAKEQIQLNDIIKEQALKFETQGRINPLDSFHLAAAEFSKVDIFCTCDKKF